MDVHAAEHRFAAALADPTLPVPAGLTSARGAPDRLRFAVYRNNVHVSLVEALAKAFPVTLRLVGDAFFRAMARAYVADHKPQSPVLSLYGSGFAAFIADFAPAARLAYLPDLARLEQAWLQAYHAAEAQPLGARDLSCLAPERLLDKRLVPHPATRLVESPFAIGSIWSTHQARDVAPVDIGQRQGVLIVRPHAEVRSTVLPAADIPFARRLFSGASIGEAGTHALACDNAFDVTRALTGLLSLGAFQRFPTNSEETAT
ncbi:MAG: HvfC/BufC N-terminal domain-containing protein [Rhizobiaceae bacterium]